MFSAATLFSLASALALGANAVINTPSGLTTCQPTLITWNATTSPYYLSVIPAGTPGTTVESLGTFTDVLKYTWDVNVPADSSIALALKDGTGSIMYTSTVTVAAGSDTSCVNVTVAATSSASSDSSSAAASSVSPSTASTAAASSASSSTSKASASSASASAASASSSSTKSGASTTVVSSVALGALGLVSAGFLAFA